jgi:hypothetical protein
MASRESVWRSGRVWLLAVRATAMTRGWWSVSMGSRELTARSFISSGESRRMCTQELGAHTTVYRRSGAWQV